MNDQSAFDLARGFASGGLAALEEIASIQSVLWSGDHFPLHSLFGRTFLFVAGHPERLHAKDRLPIQEIKRDPASGLDR